MSTTAPPTPSPVSVTTVSTYVNKVVDVLLGELLANPRVTKLISWVMVGLGALGHKYLGLDPTETAALIASGGVNQLTAFDFIMAGATAIGVGGELLPKEALHFRQEDRIRELAGRFIGMVRDARALADTYY